MLLGKNLKSPVSYVIQWGNQVRGDSLMHFLNVLNIINDSIINEIIEFNLDNKVHVKTLNLMIKQTFYEKILIA